jgi:hypothetical protein
MLNEKSPCRLISGTVVNILDCEMTPKPTHLNGSIQKQRIYIIIKLN